MTYVLTEERTGSGFKISFIRSGEAIPAYSLVYLNAAGRWMLADASAAASMPTVGLATETVVGGQLVTVLMIGATGTNAWAWTPGDEIYASETPGELTQTPPGAGAVNQVVAMAINTSTIYFNASGFSSDSGVFVGDVDIPDAVTLVNLTATDIDVSDDITVDTIDEHTADTGVTIEGVLLQDGDSLPYDQVIGVEWNQTTDTWTQIDIDGSSISPTAADFNNHQIWGNMTRVNLASDGTVNARWGDGDYAADGSNGEVMVEVPCFYVKGEQNTTGVYQWWISRVELPGFEPHPAFLQRDGRVKPYIYLSAYEGSLLVGTGAHDDTTTLKLTSVSGEQPWTGEEILELTYNSGSTEFTRGETLTGAISGHTAVVIDWYLSGGTWAGGDAAGKVYLKKRGATIASTPFQAEDLNGSTGGANMASATGAGSVLPLTIGDARGYAEAQGDGWGLLNIWSHAAVKLLFIIEYGNMDSQTEIGRGIVDKTSGDGFNGEVTGYDGIDGNLDSALTGTGTGANGLTPICYRGLENLWGNTWSFLDGYNALDAEYRIISRHGRDTFADALMDYEASSMAPITSDGYIINIEWDRTMKYLFIPSAVGGGSGTYIPDFFYAHDAGETNILLSSGGWSNALGAGLGSLFSNSVPSLSYRIFGARTEYMP